MPDPTTLPDPYEDCARPLIDALEFFADTSCWRRNGVCDPHGSRFNGTELAQKALDTYRARRAALAPAADASGWPAPRPMSEAPKDDVFLAAVAGAVRFVRWCKTSHVPLWGWCLVDQGPEDADLCEPTCWWPLPEIPAPPTKDQTP